MYKLKQLNHALALVDEDDTLGKPVFVDFVAGALAHRTTYGGGKKQLLAKAIGCHKRDHLHVIDATAGLGRDSFVLASLGCNVRAIERNAELFALLEDGYERGVQASIGALQHLQFIHADANEYLKALDGEQRPDVIYIDPMYPHNTKSALVKKEMRIVRQVVGDDLNNEALLDTAKQQAHYRVVVKRPLHAPTLTEHKPDFDYKGKRSRFDIYLPI